MHLYVQTRLTLHCSGAAHSLREQDDRVSESGREAGSMGGLNERDVKAALLNQERTIKKLQLKLANALEQQGHSEAESNEK